MAEKIVKDSQGLAKDLVNDCISRYGVAAWLDNMGYTKLAYAVMDKDRFPYVQPKSYREGYQAGFKDAQSKTAERIAETAQNVSDEDLISRKAAIDAIRASTSKYTGFMEMEMYTDDDAVEAIEALPSAQPERTCVNCGRTANNGGWYADGRTRCPIEEHYALPKDGYCHLWEKRNVTDDDYPERREK